jgi:predicted NUDIX family phosphoesterase
MLRELAEEVAMETAYTEKCVGLINDDETPVGQVHLGVVHLFDVSEPLVQPRETEILDAGFRPVDEILAELDHFESWSQIVVRALFG